MASRRRAFDSYGCLRPAPAIAGDANFVQVEKDVLDPIVIDSPRDGEFVWKLPKARARIVEILAEQGLFIEPNRSGVAVGMVVRI